MLNRLKLALVLLPILLVPVAVMYLLVPEQQPTQPLAPQTPEVVASPGEPNIPPTKIPDVLPFADEALPELPDLLAEDAKHPGPIKYTLIPRPADGVDVAVEDILRIPQSEQPFQRYIWFPQPTSMTAADLAYVLNTAVSHSQITYKPVKISEHVYRIDMQQLCPDDVSFKRLFNIWETKLESSDFWFHSLREREVAAVEKRKIKQQQTVTENQTVNELDRFGRTIPVVKPVSRVVEVEVEQDVTVTKLVPVSDFAIHTGLDRTMLLSTLTQSRMPIVNGEDFMVRALTTIQGGLYYDFVGMPRNVQGKTDLEAFVELLGAEPSQNARRPGASYVGIFKSKVTDKPRQIEYFYGTTSRPTLGPQLITLSHDLADEDVDPRKHPIRNLLSFKGTAVEAIGSRNNGTLIYSIYDNNGKILDEAPPNVVKDHQIPSPHSARLQPAISCIRCHGAEDGRKTAANNVTKLLSGSLRVLDDESSKENVQKTLDTLAGMYSGDLTYPLMVARNTHSNTVFTMTGGKSVPAVSASLGSLHIEYMFDSVTPKKAVADLGYFVENDTDAVRLIARILPPLPPNAYGVSTEDPVIATLREWDPKEPVEINHMEWLQVLSDALLRVITEEARIAAENPEIKLHKPVKMPAPKE